MHVWRAACENFVTHPGQTYTGLRKFHNPRVKLSGMQMARNYIVPNFVWPFKLTGSAPVG